MIPIEAVGAFIAPLLPGWTLQLGRWQDDSGPKVSRFAVVRPAGGGRADLLRRPQFTVMLIGNGIDSPKTPMDAADVVIEAMRESAGALMFMHPGEASEHPTQDGRSVAEFAVSTLVE